MSFRSMMIIRNLLFALIIVGHLGCDSKTPGEKTAKHRERAETYMKNGQYPEAIIEYQNVIQSEPNSSDTHYRLEIGRAHV